jgi:Proprotein convertase P-domain
MKVKATLITMLTLLVSALAASAAPAATQTFTQDGDITWDFGEAAPYGSPLAVAGVDGPITKVTVGFTDFTSTDETDDVSAVLQGPGGQAIRLMNGAGGNGSAFNVDIVFDDDAVSPLPAPLVNATFKPTDNQPGDNMPAPAPQIPYAPALSVFDGAQANGEWRLWVEDYVIPGSGSLKAWSLNITTADPPPPEKLTLDLAAAKQKLARKLTLSVDAGAAGELAFTGKARGSIEVAKGASEVDARLDPGAYKKLKRKVKKGKKASVEVEATLKADGQTAEDSVRVKIKAKKKK